MDEDMEIFTREVECIKRKKINYRNKQFTIFKVNN